MSLAYVLSAIGVAVFYVVAPVLLAAVWVRWERRLVKRRRVSVIVPQSSSCRVVSLREWTRP